MDQTQPVTETPAVTSFMTRVTNVFSSPGELYTEVASAPSQTTSWLVPLLCSLILGIVFTFALYNNPVLRQQIYDVQEEGMRKAVAQGQMTQEQMDTASERMESSGPAMFMLIGGGSTVVILAISFFGASLVLWLSAKFILKFNGSYKKMLEVFGLAAMVGVLGSVITLLMMKMLNSMHATPGGALLIMDSFDRGNMGHKLLASVNIFTLWQTGIIGIGLSKLSGKSTGTTLGLDNSC